MVTLAFEQLRVSLAGREVVRGVSATLDGGTLIGILGPNGAGKSTLVRALLGLVRSEGRVLLDGEPVAALPRAEVARRIAYLPQGQVLHWPVSVERLVALGRLPHLGPYSRMAAADHAAISRAMALAEVAALADRIATDLSGGERARVMLARALAAEAPALVADEPLAGLDPEHQLHLMTMLRDQARSGVLVVAVLHDLSLARRFCNRVLVMQDGGLVADGDPGAVLTRELIAAVYRVRAEISGHAITLLDRLG